MTNEHNAPEYARSKMKMVIVASSLGTVFEWYDFFVYGTLAVFFSVLFFPPGNEVAAVLASLAAFGAGFVVRPLGAAFFGHLGDKIGRKKTFLITIVLMGLATTLIGLLPTYATIGVAAAVLLVVLRLLQGFAVGGEYTGAAIYVAEHAKPQSRGFATSWIQTTAAFGLLLSLAVVVSCRFGLGEEAFREWGWRIPFIASIPLLAISVYIRFMLEESPAYQELKASGQTSRAPVNEAFSNRKNLKMMAVALFGAIGGQAVVWYTAHFYAMLYLINTLKVPSLTVYTLIGTAVVFAIPFYVFFGALSDRIGRKWLMIAGCLLASMTFVPTFKAISHYANPALERFNQENPITITANDCNFNIFSKPVSDCDRARNLFTKSGVSYTLVNAQTEGEISTSIGDVTLGKFDPKIYAQTLRDAGLPRSADTSEINRVMVVLLLFWLLFMATMVYGPIAAFLVELFPTRVRYTALSIPMQVGNGWIGGLVPFISAALAAYYGNVFAGLYYPVAVALICALIGMVTLSNTIPKRL